MSAQGIRTATNKALKKCYKFLSTSEKKLVKIKEDRDIAEKYLYGIRGFYKTAKRKSNGAIDWDAISDREMQLFESSNKAIDKFNRQDEQAMNKALDLFSQTQFNYNGCF